MPLSEKIQQINREISATVERTISDLRQEVAQRLRAGHDEILRRLDEISPELPSAFIPEDLGAEAEELARATARQVAEKTEEVASERAAGARRAAFTEVRDALAGIDRARSQAEILVALLRETSRFASRAVVLLLRGSELRGWGGQGFGDAEPAIRDLAFAPSAGSGWGRIGEGQSAVYLSAAECAELCSRIEAPLPHDGVLIPLVLRDRVAAGLYADRLSDELAAEAIQVLCYTAAMAIELLPFRERPFTPTLALTGAPSSSAVETAPAPSAPDQPVQPVQPVQETAPVPVMSEPEPVSAESEPEPDRSYPVAVPMPEPEPWGVATAPEPPKPEIEVELEAEEEQLEPEPAPAASPAATVFQPIPVQAYQSGSLSAAPAASEPPAPAVAAAASADQTVLLPRTPFAAASATREIPVPVETSAPPPLRPVPVVEPASAAGAANGGGGGGATPEVRPPSGVDGPGWAFSASRVAVSPSEEALHEEARRLARLLVSEIKLYNEEQVEEGRRKRDVYERLKEDIDRSRQMYEERVEPRILKSTDYFYQELVRILAAGDAKALGI
ncbi:MAG TPA: hypothetical protein VKM72_23030 [Thermoanaerobaculia bacterium]|nr:hypothetical protein [Thermoanaerobaculia bacterium]